jgi:hypothetical protein
MQLLRFSQGKKRTKFKNQRKSKSVSHEESVLPWLQPSCFITKIKSVQNLKNLVQLEPKLRPKTNFFKW